VEQAAEHLLHLFAAKPAAIAADLHPGYLSADWARRFAAARGIPLVTVQHHEAHAAAILAEHFGAAAPPGDPCLVACFDGTGYWPDGSIAGGEFFIADGGAIRRAAHLTAFPLPGGDAAIRHPWRTALAVLHAASLPWDDRLPAVQAASESAQRLLRQQLDRGLACVPQAARAPDLAADRYRFRVSPAADGSLLEADWRPVVKAVVAEVLAATPSPVIAAGFHRAVTRLIDEVRDRLLPAGATVGLTGGVFQNALLVERSLKRLRTTGSEVLLHHLVPPNDGGLALGQALLARGRLAAATFSPP
jgi:hydrogenase maturation protein HypF